MKRILIVGTSHSEATCQRTENGPIDRMNSGRWYDYFKDLGHSVTCLARAGCTVEQQFMAVHSYFQENPNAKFDLAIIEGRSLETNVSIPGTPGPSKITYADFWRRYDTSLGKDENYRWEIDNVDSQKIEQYPEYKPYYVDYVFSLLHSVQHWSTNYAMCKLIEEHADVVKWFAFSTATIFNKNPELKELAIGYDMMKSYFISEDCWPYPRLRFDNDMICACHHMNENGHSHFWNEFIYPRVKQYL